MMTDQEIMEDLRASLRADAKYMQGFAKKHPKPAWLRKRMEAQAQYARLTLLRIRKLMRKRTSIVPFCT
jgi:hypothetical protein